MKPVRYVILLCTLLATYALSAQPDPWPEPTRTARPWSRWWWMGSAVDEQNLSTLLQRYAEAGFGGLEIAPIYGAQGYEDRFVPFLSPRWMDLLRFTVGVADRLDMTIDLTTGTGWPMGGPQVDRSDAATQLVFKRFSLTGGKPFIGRIQPDEPEQRGAGLAALVAYDARGNSQVLTDRVATDGTLNWRPPAGQWVLYALFEGTTRQRVKRAAPGGEGYTLDHLSAGAVDRYLARFDSAFQSGPPGVRAFYNDSYEVYGADWSPGFFDTFRQRRGYDLRGHVRELLSDDTADVVSRIKSDYRETMAELLLDNFTRRWTTWTRRYGGMTKNQAHGSPGNLLDLYGAVDIPEAETFGSSYFPIPGLRRDSADIRNVDPDPVMLKFASSAAHVMGRPLVSCETFTWLTEHFKTALSQCKPEVEQAFLAGINHVFYHGITYSPQDAGWPGWLFYASVNFVPNNSWWPHLDGLNGYITRVQSVLQSGQPDNELLVYWPVYDNWDKPAGRMMTFTVHNIDEWLHPTPFYRVLTHLQRAGYSADFISDRQLAGATVTDDGRIRTALETTPYRALVIPVVRRMPLKTMQQILDLARQGATVILQAIPEDVPGLTDYPRRHAAFRQAAAAVPSSGAVVEADPITALQARGIPGEPLAAYGLHFIRRRTADETYYYVVNHQAGTVDARIPLLNTEGPSIVLLDPQTGAYGTTPCEPVSGGCRVRIQLRSGEAVIVRIGHAPVDNLPAWTYTGNEVQRIPLAGRWQVDFLEGGPERPEPLVMETLACWTDQPGEAYRTFSGTAVYQTTVTVDPVDPGAIYLLELEGVHESGRVYINGRSAGLAWSFPFRLPVGQLLRPGINTITIEVANLMANRIRAMDRQAIPWRRYHEINFVDIGYQPFDASNWPVQPSGLAGPVTLVRYKSD